MGDTKDVERTRAAYDVVAEDYAELLRDQLAGNPYDRAMLDLFAEQIASAGGGLVGDLGCGPGRVAAYLTEHGVDVVGVDLSPGMVAVARRDHPDIPFHVASMTALPFADGELVGALAWYSIIHTAPAGQPGLFAEFARGVRPGGVLLLAFQVGDDVVHLTHAYGHEVDLYTRRQEPDRVRELLRDAGFEVVAQLVREPLLPEKVPQAYLMARRAS